MQYVLGVDGGNTKSDYLLTDISGALIGHIRAGTCSHEALGMEGAKVEMDLRIGELLGRAGLSREQIAAAAFGLAGVDQPAQQNALAGIVKELGFARSIVMNDSFLGIKAGSETGVGICSINGTGTASGGIDMDDKWVQVGGCGFVTGDDAGGGYIARRTIRAAYDAAYRFGEKTALLPMLLKRFECEAVEDLHTAISVKFQTGGGVSVTDVVTTLFAASDQGDAVAMALVREVADALARSAAGCAVRLRFEGSIPVVLIGSVWTKGRYQPMIDQFGELFEQYARQEADIRILSVPPAAGSVLWAIELVLGQPPSLAIRKQVFDDTRGL